MAIHYRSDPAEVVDRERAVRGKQAAQVSRRKPGTRGQVLGTQSRLGHGAPHPLGNQPIYLLHTEHCKVRSDLLQLGMDL